MSMLKYDIEEAIRKNLSQEVGTELRKELDELEKLRKQVAELQSYASERESRIKTLDAVIAKAGDITKREDAVGIRERDVTKRENNQALNELKVDLAEKRVADVKEIASIFGRNPMFINTKSVTGGRDVPCGTDNYGRQHISHNETIVQTEQQS